MIKMKTYSLAFAAGMGLLASLASCSKEDSFASYEEVQKGTYANSFVAKYGPISANQSWDFTTGEQNLVTRGFSSIKTEIMKNGVDFGDVSNLTFKDFTFNGHPEWDYKVITGGVKKNIGIYEAIEEVLPEKVRKQGKSAVLVAPANAFYIYPLFCGGGYRYDLMVKVGDAAPVKVFSKDFTDFQMINGMKTKDGKTVNMRGIRIEAPVGTPVEIYLDNVFDVYNNAKPTVGTTNGYAVYVDIPENVKLELDGVELADDHVVKYIGIEDVLQSDDFDYNDLVLAVVGDPNVPQEKIITEDQYEVNTCRAKRYMIEDLGAIGDFDFNDVVVDVEEYTVYTHKITSENGIKTSDEVISTTTAPTKAFVRAMGGTIDFELVIGDTKWVKSQGFNSTTMYNTQGSIDYEHALAEFEVTGYNYDNNNISFRANGKDGQLYTVTFPKTGEAPMMIAVDPTTKWMDERVSIPSSWFSE